MWSESTLGTLPCFICRGRTLDLTENSMFKIPLDYQVEFLELSHWNLKTLQLLRRRLKISTNFWQGWFPKNSKIFIFQPKLTFLRENHKNDGELLDFYEFTLHMIFANFLKNVNLGLKIKNLKIRKIYHEHVFSKVGCVFAIAVVSILPHTELGRNDYGEDASHFILRISK